MSIKILNDKYYYTNDPIGFGSFSIIFKGTNYHNNTVIAIKKINKIIDKTHFNNEVRLMKKLNHPNILKFYDIVYKTKKEIYFILEYCNGGDLSEYIDSKSTDFDSKYFYEILDSLNYLYKNGVLHRDIKPQNILIKDNTIKIADFGFAKSFSKNDLLTTFCGSPLYMAPEIILNKEYTNLSDIWSLGVVLYELLTKTHPYRCEERSVLWNKIKNNEVNIDFNLITSTNKKKIITKMLQYDFTLRISWKDLFDHIKKQKARSYSFNETDFTKEMIKTPFIPKKTIHNLSKSQTFRNNEIINYNDCEVVSNSLPNKLGSYYMEKYVNQKKEIADNNMPVLGNRMTTSNSYIFTDYLNKSVSTFKGFFN